MLSYTTLTCASIAKYDKVYRGYALSEIIMIHVESIREGVV